TVETVSRGAVDDFGVRSSVSVLTLSAPLPRRLPRRAATVWADPRTPALTVPTFPEPDLLTGTSVPVASPSPGIDRGRAVVITGRPVGLVVISGGGAHRVVGGRAEACGPDGCDAVDLAEGADGTVHLATGEGVFALSPGPDHPARQLDQGWPEGPATAIAVAGGTVVAGTARGLLALAEAPPGGPIGTWLPLPVDGEITALATSGEVVWAASATGAVLGATAAGPASSWSWRSVGVIAGAVDALCAAGGSVWAAGPDEVVRITSGRTVTLPSLPAPASALAVDGRGLWAATGAGLMHLPHGGREWATVAIGTPGAVDAVTGDGGSVVAVGAGGLVRVSNGRVVPIAGSPPVTASAVAVGRDGSAWIAARSSGPSPVMPGPAVRPEDLTTLDQRGLPSAIVDALADAGSPLAADASVEPHVVGSSWVISSGADLWLVAARRTSSGTAVVLGALPDPTWATGPAGADGSWPVEILGVRSTLRAPPGSILVRPGDDRAPVLTEPATVAAVTATSIELTSPLRHAYDASTASILANIVRASHGTPVTKVLGTGDPDVPNQSFRVPTLVASLTPPEGGGAPRSTLQVTVDGVRWRATEALSSAGPTDRTYLERRHHDGTVTVQFGDGTHGARLPRGPVVASWLQGGGDEGAVTAGSIAQLLDRPRLAVGVSNPLPATRVPAADPVAAARAEQRCLGRAVTLTDVAELTRVQPGVASASADLVASPAGEVVVVSVATTPDAPPGLVEELGAALDDRLGVAHPVVFVAATTVPVSVRVEVTGGPDSRPVEAEVAAALAGLRPLQPGDALVPSDLVAAAARAPGVTDARVVAWGPLHREARARPRAEAGRAAWPTGASAPTPAELLTVEAAGVTVRVSVEEARP
ncbi:MAG TPA: hypothetical protein VK507_19365, partial [Iamia sp.]|nr:hypothetical protein [Iamia sp.]